MTEIIKVPTGHIGIVKADSGLLEFVSLADYGKAKNIKADFLKLTNKINGVPHGNLLPLEDKWVITISTQYGCAMNCTFCDVPKVGPGKNASTNDMLLQLRTAFSLHPEVKATKRLNIHFARMGEPTFNPAVLKVGTQLLKYVQPYVGRSHVHPVISTMMPNRNTKLVEFLTTWVSDIKNRQYRGSAGLQFSINSTDDIQRKEMFAGNSLDLVDIARIGAGLEPPVGRKFTLNFALADTYKVDALRLRGLFDPRKFMVKLTPLHYTKACKDTGLASTSMYELFAPYEKVEAELLNEGFDVLTFVPSIEEDKSRITCGNAILADKLL